MNALEIRDLTKHYTGFSLNHLNLTLPWGCIWGLWAKTVREKAPPSS